MNVTLNDAEQRLAKYLAKCRYANARGRGIPDAKMGDQSNWLTDLEGAAAEIAFCKLFNLYPDTETMVSDTPNEDAVTRGGYTIDIKTTRYQSGRLVATLKKRGKKCDLYGLMVGSFPTYRFAGWTTADQFLIESNIGDLGHGPGYVMTQDQLNRGEKHEIHTEE